MEKLNNKEAIAVILTIILNTFVMLSTQILVEACSSASLINAVFVSIIALIITYVLCALYKNFVGLNILDVAEFLGGKFFKFFVGILFFIYFSFTMIILLRRIVDCLQIVYYPMTNIMFVTLLFIIATGILCNLKNNASIKANLIFLPISIISLILILVGNIKNLNLQNVYPILGNGINSTFVTGISNLFTFSGIAYIFFLPSKMKKTNNLKKVSLIAILLSSVSFIITVATVVFMFNNELSSGQLFPLYIAVRYIEFGTFLQRLDSAFLLIRIIAFISFLGIVTNLCLEIFKNITNISDTKPISYPYLLCIFGFTILLKESSMLEFFENSFFKILFFGIVIGLGFIVLILANLKKLKSKI